MHLVSPCMIYSQGQKQKIVKNNLKELSYHQSIENFIFRENIKKNSSAHIQTFLGGFLTCVHMQDKGSQKVKNIVQVCTKLAYK